MDVIIPGEKVSDKPERFQGTSVSNGSTYANVVGFYDKDRNMFVQLVGMWEPREGDIVVGQISSKRSRACYVDLNFPYKGEIQLRYEETRLSTGDVIEAEVRDFRKFEDEALVSLTRPKVLHGGMLVAVKPTKVPRILGKANTMIKQIAEGTGSSLVVGMNGMLWIKGGDMNLVEKLIREVEEKAHTNGLTDKIKQEIDAYKNPK